MHRNTVSPVSASTANEGKWQKWQQIWKGTAEANDGNRDWRFASIRPGRVHCNSDLRLLQWFIFPIARTQIASYQNRIHLAQKIMGRQELSFLLCLPLCCLITHTSLNTCIFVWETYFCLHKGIQRATDLSNKTGSLQQPTATAWSTSLFFPTCTYRCKILSQSQLLTCRLPFPAFLSPILTKICFYIVCWFDLICSVVTNVFALSLCGGCRHCMLLIAVVYARCIHVQISFAIANL